MRIIVASDQVGFPLKQAVLKHLESRGATAIDGGPATDERVVDYPDFAALVGRAINGGEYDRGILICGSGLGMSIAANRLRGIRAALCHDVYTAHMARAHNNANVLCMGAWVVTPQRAEGIVDEWLSAEYERGRHVARLVKLDDLAQADVSRPPRETAARVRPFQTTLSLSPNQSVFGPLLFAGQLEEGLRAAAAAGFDGVELSLRTPQEIDVKRLRDQLREAGLAVSGIATSQSFLHDGLAFCHPDPQVRAACVERVKSLVPIAAELKATLILGGIRGRFVGAPASWGPQREGAIVSMREVARVAISQGVEVVVEPINRYETNFVNTAAEGLALIEAMGEPSVKLLLDTFHMNIEEADISETLRQVGQRIGYVHVADSNRQAPGAGHVPFAKILQTLADLGYDGYVGAEVLPLPDDRSAAQQAGDFLRTWMREGQPFDQASENGIPRC